MISDKIDAWKFATGNESDDGYFRSIESGLG